ncbi:MAG: hypothetical protein PWR07_1090 [Bacillota bacterium]|nr:hypothetical protein [Bacillota bacterium]
MRKKRSSFSSSDDVLPIGNPEGGSIVREEHMMILKMLEEGKITSEEAAALIDALDEAVEGEEGAPCEGGEGSPGLREAAREAGQTGEERKDAAGACAGAGAGAGAHARAGAGADAGADAGAATGDAAGTEGRDADEGGRAWGTVGHGPDFAKIRALADKLAHLAEASYGPALESLAERIEKTVERAMKEKERAIERAMRAKERAAEKLGEDFSEPHLRFRWGEPSAWVEAFTEPFLGAFAPGVRVKKTFEGSFDAKVNRVTIEATTSNGGITIEPWDGPGFRVEIRARVRGAAGDPGAAQARLEDSIEYETGPGRLRIDCSGGKVVSGAALTIQLPRGFQYDLDLETSNGKVEVGTLECGTIEVETSNGRIDLDGARAVVAKLETSNGRIQCKGAAKKLVAETSNGSIFVAPARPAGNAVYELETSNGSIEVQLAASGDVGYSIEAETSHGGIHVDLPNLVYQVNTTSMGHKEIVASTAEYEARANKLRIKAETSNGSITIIGVGAVADGSGQDVPPHTPDTSGMPGAPGAPGTPGLPESESQA